MDKKRTNTEQGSLDDMHAIRKKAKPGFHYEIIFTNARFAQSFWIVACKALPHLFFHLEVTDDYSGLRLEAHDSPPTMAIKSIFECIIREGVDAQGSPVSRSDLHGEVFCVTSKNLLKVFQCTQLKDAPLRLVKYHGKDGISFEAQTNEEDVQTSFMLPFCSKTPSNVLQKLKAEGLRIEMATHVLQKLASVAGDIEATTLRFELFGAPSTDPDITRNKLTVAFPGAEISGSYDFVLNKKTRIVSGVHEYEAVASTDNDATDWSRLSSHSYLAAKFKLFISSLKCERCFVTLPPFDAKSRNMVIVADCEGGKTSHTIFVSPQEDEDEE
jgi:hypothetical protein